MYRIQYFQAREELNKLVSGIHILHVRRAVALTAFPQPEVNMSIYFRGTIDYMYNSGYRALSDAVVNKRYNDRRTYRIAAGTSIIIVNFRIGALGAFFNLPSVKYDNDLVDVKSIVAALPESLRNAATDKERITKIEDFLLQRLTIKNADIPMMYAADHIRFCNGSLKIGGLSKSAYLSESQFERRFRRSAGCSAKKYASLVRLQKIIIGETIGDDVTSKAYEAGYFDQAHFIRDFKAFTGYTPKHFFRIQGKLQLRPLLGFADFDME